MDYLLSDRFLISHVDVTMCCILYVPFHFVWSYMKLTKLLLNTGRHHQNDSMDVSSDVVGDDIVVCVV